MRPLWSEGCILSVFFWGVLWDPWPDYQLLFLFSHCSHESNIFLSCQRSLKSLFCFTLPFSLSQPLSLTLYQSHVSHFFLLLGDGGGGWFWGPLTCQYFSAMTSAAPQGDRAPESCPISQIKTAPTCRHLCIESLCAWFSEATGGWKELSSIHNLVTFNLKLASSTALTGHCHLMKIALLCNLLAELLCRWGLSWDMEAFYEQQERIGNCVFPACSICWGVEWLDVWCFWYTRRGTCKQPVWICPSVS